MKQTFSLCFLLSIIHGSTIRPLCQPHQYLILKQCLCYGYEPGILHAHPLFGTHFLPPKNHATPLIRNTTRFAKKKVETFSIRQTANPSLQLRVCSFALPSFYISARRSVQFSSFLFSQNIIQYKNKYRNCKVAREPRTNQRANEAWASESTLKIH